MTHEISRHELKLLRSIASNTMVEWGAAVGSSLESLKGAGLIVRQKGGFRFTLTDAGRQVLRDNPLLKVVEP